MKKSLRKTNKVRKIPLGYHAFFFMLIVSMLLGCSANRVSLKPTSAATETFKTVDINPDKYAFFTAGPEATPEAILLIANEHMGDFNSSGWKLRDKKTIMNLLKAISSKGSIAKKYGFPVVGKDGVEKGKLYTTMRVGRMSIDKEDESFSVATPEMLDIGKGAYKRTSCSISICQ